jgi:hypothetical protein
MAIPSEPLEFGSAARIWRPALVSVEGLATQTPP